MAGSLNKVTLIGNIGRDPEIRTTQDGREVANISIATTESWKDKTTGERKEKTEWHRVVIFAQHIIGLIKNYISKGSKVYIEGSLQTRKWNDQSGRGEIYYRDSDSAVQWIFHDVRQKWWKWARIYGKQLKFKCSRQRI